MAKKGAASDLWRIFYADGSTVSNKDCAPEDVPGYGVEAIATPDRREDTGNVGYLVLARFDWYYWRTDSEEWVGAMGDGSMEDLLLHREPIVGWCRGRRIPDDRYNAILSEAQAWAEEHNLPRKSGLRPGELG